MDRFWDMGQAPMQAHPQPPLRSDDPKAMRLLLGLERHLQMPLRDL